jgi:hypothetical protein
MPIPQIFYLNAPSLGSATAVFYDAALTVCAADGYYSDGLITREQVGCVLLPQEDCPFCGASCSPLGEITTESSQGLYRISVNTGENPTDIGAIIIEFNVNDVPNGIIATLNTNTYNELSSVTEGYLASSVLGTVTYVGKSADNCGLYGGGTTLSLPVSSFDGVNWITTGGSESFTMNPAYTVLTTNAPGKCIMVIPKLSNLFNTLIVDIVTACDPDDDATITINCPSLLRSFTASIAEDNDEIRCDLPTNVTYYVAPVNGVNPYLGLFDWIFTDAYGENKLADGKYKTNFLTLPNDTIEVQDGVIIAITQTCF